VGHGRRSRTTDTRFRSASESGPSGGGADRLLSAISGCEQLQQRSSYSITSSARASSVPGTSRTRVVWPPNRSSRNGCYEILTAAASLAPDARRLDDGPPQGHVGLE
jgi:hypothetical protein